MMEGKQSKQRTMTQFITVSAKVQVKNDDIHTSRSDNEKNHSEPFVSLVDQTWWSHLPPPPKIFFNTTRRQSYTIHDDRLMLTYLINKDCIFSGKSQTPWKEMKEDGYFADRTIESLRNHFRRHILPKVENYKLPQHLQEMFISYRSLFDH